MTATTQPDSAAARPIKLTKREIETLRYIARGYSNQKTADTLFVSKRTIDCHLANASQKLQVHNRMQAVGRARMLGLI